MVSRHYQEERLKREKAIAKIGYGRVLKTVYMYRQKEGLQIHRLTSTGIILIYDATTHRLITKLIARPGQVQRFYPQGDYPAEVMERAIFHKKLGLNNL